MNDIELVMIMTDTNKHIIIIGGGYSGALTAINLLLKDTAPLLKITLVEQRAYIGMGLAYTCWDDNLLLNVPAGNMSAFITDPDHFVRFCQTLDPAFNKGSFISRRIYGDYLQQSLQQAIRNSIHEFESIKDEALAVKKIQHKSNFIISLKSLKTLVGDQVVLALGHFPSKNLLANSNSSLNNYVNNPLDWRSIDQLSHDQTLLIVGTGHTAIDVLFRLTSSNPSRSVIMLSRKGLLPEGHRFNPQPPLIKGFPIYLESVPKTIRAYMQAIRQEARLRMDTQGDWRDVLNELRPYTAQLWQSLPEAERRRFLRHVLAYWDVHRHRLAPSAHQRLKVLLKQSTIKLLAARIRAIQPIPQGFEVEIQTKTNEIQALNVGAVINCTGPNNHLTSIPNPLIQQLLAEGLILPDALHIGVQIDEHYQLINAAGTATKDLYYVGPMLKAHFWESIAVPELRAHTHHLAGIIVDNA